MGAKVSTCGYVWSLLEMGETRRIECHPVIVGSIVKIQMRKAKERVLTLAEVEVFGVYGKMALLYVLYSSLLFISDT